jgi:thiosulfate/3-mercaptopyruvate sulfurtransferase
VSDAKLVQVGELLDELGDPSLRILDATAFLRRDVDGGPYVVESGRHAFDQCHIPDAVFADVLGELSDPHSPFRFTLPLPDEFSRAIGALGVGDDTRVVVYAQATPMWATRVWWLLRYFGFGDVRVLDGGLVAWIEAGFRVSASRSKVHARRFVATPRPELLAAKDDVVRFAGGEPACLVNALPSKAFRGEGPGAYTRPGRIPGSISLPSGDLLDPSTGRFLDADHLARVLEPVVSSSDGPIVAYCGGGISATVDIFALSLIGRDDVMLYDGSLTEWSADPSLPLVVD